jgi:flagellar motor switch/type III secretory pathway protein FliN
MSSSPNSSSSSEALPAPRDPLGWLMDLRCPVDFVLGTATLKVRDCMRLEPNAVIRLAQPAGADLEMRLSGTPLAAAEVAVLDGRVAARVSRIVPPGPQVTP